VVLFAKATKGKDSAGVVAGLDEIDPEELLVAATGSPKDSNRQLSKALVEDMKGDKGLVCHD
jgi:hypothetical protein